VREVVRYAAERGITVLPEIEMPGHAMAAIAAYPELGNTGKPIEVLTYWGITDHVLGVTDNVLRFFEDVFDEVLELFPSKFIHVGGDECPKTEWRNTPSAQERMKKEGLKNEDELQSWFIRHFDSWLAKRGRRLVGWDEILEGALAEVLWSPPETRNWADFEKRLATHLERLAILDVNYRGRFVPPE